MSINRYSINRAAINAIAAAAATIGHAAVFGASGDFTASGTRSNARQGTAQFAASGGFTASGKKVASNSKTVTGSGSGAINSSAINSRALNGAAGSGSAVVPIPFVFSASGGFTASGKKGINATAKFYDSAYSIAAGEKTAFSNRSITASSSAGSGGINGRAINAAAINKVAGSVTTFTPVPIIFAASGGFGASGGSSANPGHSAVFAGSGDFQAAGKQPKEFANFWASGGFSASGFKRSSALAVDSTGSAFIADGGRKILFAIAKSIATVSLTPKR